MSRSIRTPALNIVWTSRRKSRIKSIIELRRWRSLEIRQGSFSTDFGQRARVWWLLPTAQHPYDQ